MLLCQSLSYCCNPDLFKSMSTDDTLRLVAAPSKLIFQESTVRLGKFVDSAAEEAQGILSELSY